MKKLTMRLTAACCLVLCALAANVRASDPTIRMDFDNDGKDDIGVFDSLPITVQNLDQPTYFRYLNSGTNQVSAVQWGLTLDHSAVADYDGDGTPDPTIFRYYESLKGNSTNQWWINGSATGVSVIYYAPPQYYGNKMPGDYDGDGKANLGTVYTLCDPGDPKIPEDDYCATYYGYLLPNNESFVAQAIGYSVGGQSYGGGIPARGDYDGNGTSDIAVYRQSEQKFIVFARDYTPASITNIEREQVLDIDLPAPGDFNGDGRTDFVGVKNFQSENLQPLVWKCRYNRRTPQPAVGFEIEWGLSNEYPVPADYDGDGKTDLAVYNKETGVWKIRRSSDLTTLTYTLGDAADTPLTFPLQNPFYFNPF